jgi:hypothetical protein
LSPTQNLKQKIKLQHQFEVKKKTEKFLKIARKMPVFQGFLVVIKYLETISINKNILPVKIGDVDVGH